MKVNNYHLAGVMVGVPAWYWFADLTNWKIAIALVLCLFANNLSQVRNHDH